MSYDEELFPPAWHETACVKCTRPIVLFAPTSYQLEEPWCPLCAVSSLEGVCRLLHYPKPQLEREH